MNNLTRVAIASLMAMSPVVAMAKSDNCGGASWYALHSRTASGERMNPSKLTAAHRSLKFGTKLLVTNKKRGTSVIVRINDRGPFVRGRVLDLSKAAANQIGIIGAGHGQVCYTVVKISWSSPWILHVKTRGDLVIVDFNSFP